MEPRLDRPANIPGRTSEDRERTQRNSSVRASTKARHPVGRGPKVRAAVLEATLAELAETGYAALTVDGVARRAGVHKTTVYRRWKDRDALIVDALSDRAAAQTPIPDTGDIGTDLRDLARTLVRRILDDPAGSGAVVVASDATRVPEVAEIKRRFFADRYRHAEPVITRAVERGQLPADTDPEDVIKALMAPIFLRLLVTADPLDEATADQAARIALAAARSHVLSRPDAPTAQDD